MLGANFNARLLLSVSDTRSNMEAYIFEGEDTLTKAGMENTSKMVPLISDGGEFNFTLRADKLGRQKFYGFISVRRPDGNSEKFVFEDHFEVGRPTITISPVVGNILYRGIDNIIDVGIPGVAIDKIKYKVANGVLTLNKDGLFSFRAEQGNMTSFTMSAVIDGSLISFQPLEFRIIDTPDPVVSIGGNRTGSISIKDIKSSGGLDIRLENFPYDVKYALVGFTIVVIDPLGPVEEKTKGPLFSEKQKTLISRLKPGDYLFIKDVTTIAPDGKIRPLNDLIFKITD
jgi:hypothetical protein